MIAIGQALPAGEFTFITAEGKQQRDSQSLFGGKRVVLFAVPGAFTPTCSNAHLPGYVVLADKFKEKGVDAICCLSVNDAFVMKAWQDTQNAEAITMLADGDGSWTRALGLAKETGAFGGVRPSALPSLRTMAWWSSCSWRPPASSRCRMPRACWRRCKISIAV